MASSQQFADDFESFIIDFDDATEQTVRATTALTWEAIIDDWPVLEGRSRANWFATNKAPSQAMTSREDKAGKSTTNAAIRQVMNAHDWSEFYLTNNLPYSHVIEFGGYPNPVANGTRQKDGSYKKMSSGGYSKKAPQGAVRINMARSKSLLEKEGKKRLGKL